MKKENNDRVFPGTRGPRPDLHKIKCDEAKERQAHYDSLSVDEKIAKLDLKLGKGVGAKYEREKLQAQKENADAKRQAKA
jgi:hypothetical protein